MYELMTAKKMVLQFMDSRAQQFLVCCFQQFFSLSYHFFFNLLTFFFHDTYNTGLKKRYDYDLRPIRISIRI